MKMHVKNLLTAPFSVSDNAEVYRAQVLGPGFNNLPLLHCVEQDALSSK